MVRLVIDIPEAKSTLVKQILKELGVTIQQENKPQPSAYKKKIIQVSTWTEKDLQAFDEGKNAFENFTPNQ